MGFAAVQRIVGFLIAASSLMMLPPVLVSLWYDDGTAKLFLLSAAILLVTGLSIFLPLRHVQEDLRLRDGFLIVAVCWLALAVVGANVSGLLYFPMARTVMGGLMSSVVLTLLVLPYITLGTEGLSNWFARVWRRSGSRRLAEAEAPAS